MADPAPIVVAVTGVGAIIGQGVVRSLRQARHSVRIIGVDRSDRSPGLSMVDQFERKPGVDEASEEYLDFWQKLIRKHGVRLVMPGIESDVQYFDERRAEFNGSGSVLVLNDPALIRLAADKWDFGLELARLGIPVIPTVRPGDWAEATAALGQPPFVLKPTRGNGSRGVTIVNDQSDFEYWRQKAGGEWMLQRLVGTPEEEYTAGVFGLGGGEALGPIIFRRRLSATGHTVEAEVVPEHPVLQLAIRDLVRQFRPLGPTNLQFRVEGPTAFLLEINPRFSSSGSLRTAFGFNEAEMSIDQYLHGVRPRTPVVQAGIGWRYAEDFVLHAGCAVGHSRKPAGP